MKYVRGTTFEDGHLIDSGRFRWLHHRGLVDAVEASNLKLLVERRPLVAPDLRRFKGDDPLHRPSFVASLNVAAFIQPSHDPCDTAHTPGKPRVGTRGRPSRANDRVI